MRDPNGNYPAKRIHDIYCYLRGWRKVERKVVKMCLNAIFTELSQVFKYPVFNLFLLDDEGMEISISIYEDWNPGTRIDLDLFLKKGHGVEEIVALAYYGDELVSTIHLDSEVFIDRESLETKLKELSEQLKDKQL